MNSKAVMRMRQISTQTVYALVKPVSMMAEPKNLRKTTTFGSTHIFFIFSLAKQTQKSVDWKQNILSSVYLVPLSFIFVS